MDVKIRVCLPRKYRRFMLKVSTENDNNFGYEKITIVVDNIPLILNKISFSCNVVWTKMRHGSWVINIY
jgi:hypothetical protein